MNTNAPPRTITPDQARRRCDPGELDFTDTNQARELPRLLAQHRAGAALEFGSRVDGPGFNLYVLGTPGSLRHEIIQQFLEQESAGREAPGDLCYVNNFRDERKPRHLLLPPGLGPRFRDDIAGLVEDLQASIPAAFESESYRAQVEELHQELQERHKKALAEIGEEAEENGLTLMPTPNGFAIAPVRKGQVISEEEFQALPEETRRKTEQAIARLSEKLKKHLEGLPAWHKERRERMRELDKHVIILSVGGLIQELRERYKEFPGIVEYLDAMEADALEHSQQFQPMEGPGPGLGLLTGHEPQPAMNRYSVNLMVENQPEQGAPVVYESMPSHQNLIGNVEHRVEFGNLVTDYRLIRPGSLHQANGGYIIVDAERVLTQPLAWESLKRALFRNCVKIESAGALLSLASTEGLEPEPVPLRVKVIMVGSRLLYYLLSEYDPDFNELFKVAADFDDQLDRTPENTALYGRIIASLARQRDLKPFSAAAVARVIEQGARYAGDAEKLSTRLRGLADLLSEADHICRERGGQQVETGDVQQAIRWARDRHSRMYEQILEAIQRNDILIDTTGSKPAQVNGLSVFRLSDVSFGLPARITATVRLGKGTVLDIERESKLGGAIHSKGVMILSSYLGTRYTRDWPFALSASLVFEQNYGGVEGDSASAAELCALLSAIGKLPVRQDLAITGSVNQHGDIQSIGGVNEKIEGFFDVCAGRGLSGSQGVLIPASNIKHLMLREDVVEAIGEGRFQVYPVAHVDEAASLMFGLPAGEAGEDGEFPEGSLHAAVAKNLARFRDRAVEFARLQNPVAKAKDDAASNGEDS